MITAENPYVGPRTFTREESHLFFGREREARQLLSRVISERLVLFYAQSGAGKSSLINTCLIPQLQEANYNVFPIGRVSGELPEGVSQVDNIFVFNLMLNLDQGNADPNYLAQDVSLSQFLADLMTSDPFPEHSLNGEVLTHENDEDDDEFPHVLIIDQFEEVITTHMGRWQERDGFFRQLNQAMIDDPLLWVVLTLREDYIASLEPYAYLLDDKLRARLYMQRMGYKAALDAIKKPAEQAGRAFAPGVAEILVDNLRQIRVHGQAETQLEQFVEPVQLQVACYQLWENLRNRPPGEITERDLHELGDVDTALAQFYEQIIVETIRQTNVSEIDVRSWFESQLVTEAKTRGTVYVGQHRTGGLDNEAVDFLASRFLLRAEMRAGGIWYELVHDRFITPILQANQAWRLRQPLIHIAQEWADSSYSDDKLLEGRQLKEALATNWKNLGSLVEEFLQASQVAQEAQEEIERQRKLEQAQTLANAERQRAEEQLEAKRRLRRLTIALAIVFLIAVAAAIWALILQQRALSNAEFAESKAATASAAQATARAEEVQAVFARVTAEARRVEAEEARATSDALRIEADALRIEVEEAPARAIANQQATLEALATLETEIETQLLAVTATPVPNLNQLTTATPEALQTQLAQVRETETAVAQCSFEPPDKLGEIWEKYKERLRCPIKVPFGGHFAEQPFEHGFMFWSQLRDLHIVVISDDKPSWYLISRREATGSTECPPSITVPPGRFQPVLGFGDIWCGWENIRTAIGFATAEEYAVSDNQFQEFERGAILLDGNEYIYVFFTDDGTYIREKQ